MKLGLGMAYTAIYTKLHNWHSPLFADIRKFSKFKVWCQYKFFYKKLFILFRKEALIETTMAVKTFNIYLDNNHLKMLHILCLSHFGPGFIFLFYIEKKIICNIIFKSKYCI